MSRRDPSRPRHPLVQVPGRPHIPQVLLTIAAAQPMPYRDNDELPRYLDLGQSQIQLVLLLTDIGPIQGGGGPQHNSGLFPRLHRNPRLLLRDDPRRTRT